MKPRLFALLGTAALVPTAFVAMPASAPAASPAAPVLKDGVTAPTYSYGNAIRETVWVETGDLNDDGKPEKIAADIVRPRELDGNTRVPVVMDASPYYLSSGRGNEAEKKTYNEDGTVKKMPLAYDNFFVPRGYAYVALDMAGTARSTGCVDQGGRSDIESAKAVVEWLAGKGTARDANGNIVKADWSAGRTGMIGKSYDGTLANGVAASGAKGLSTIVPIGAISSWYDYNRWQGLIKSSDYPTRLSRSVASNRTIPTDCSATLNSMSANDGDQTGAYTDFWAERDYRDGPLYNASKIKASALVVHGLQDNNVKTPNFSKWWESLGQAGVTRKMFLTRLGHVDPFDSDRERWTRVLHRWFDHELMGIDNGITEEPAVSAEVAPDRWEHSPVWPIDSARTVALRPQANGALALGAAGKGATSYVNDPNLHERDAVLPGDNRNRLLFTSGELKKEVRLSGAPTVDLEITHDAPAGQVVAYLVDFGEAKRISATEDGAETLATESCWGESTPEDDACYLDVGKRVESTPLQVLARGGVRLDGPGTHKVRVELMANDVVIPEGHQIGVVVMGGTSGYAIPLDRADTTYSVNLEKTRLNLPVSGSLAGLTPKPLKVRDLPQGAIPKADPTARPN